MANLSNYPVQITSSIEVRPSRLEDKDFSLLNNGEQTVVFGQTTRDVVEIYVYDDSGNIVGHINLRPGDSELSLSTQVSSVSQDTYLNIDLASTLSKITEVVPGRYTMTVNFFRDEVGSEEGYKLYITDISPSRTELRLKPVSVSQTITKDIFEFTSPSVTKEYAQALIDQIFRMSLNFTDADSLTSDKVVAELEPNIVQRLQTSNSLSILNAYIISTFPRIRNRLLDNIAANGDLQIQDSELQAFILDTVREILQEDTQNGLINPDYIFI